MRRELTIWRIEPQLLAEFGLVENFDWVADPPYKAFRCDDPAAEMIPINQIVATVRALNDESLRWHLARVRDGSSIEPVQVYREPGAATVQLLDGMHRWRVATTLSYTHMPVIQRTKEDAELLYRYSTPADTQ